MSTQSKADRQVVQDEKEAAEREEIRRDAEADVAPPDVSLWQSIKNFFKGTP